MNTVRHVEGKTWLIVPSASLREDPPPTSPVFFNPAASLNRDISVALVEATGGSSFCDSMAGVGARGVRVATEVSRIGRVTMVDFNAEALKLARRSAALNEIGRKCEFSNSETSSFLYSTSGEDDRFDYVDVDPFGTPVRQLQAALCATASGGILSVTATDTAVLCGVYPGVSKRRYGANTLNNHFHHETGIRILIGAVARHAALLDIGVEPVAAHSTKHYVRVYVRVSAGASKADASLVSLGYVAWCPSCGHTALTSEAQGSCQSCGRRAKVAGPLWAGRLTDAQEVRRATGAAEKMGLDDAAKVLRSLVGVDEFPPWSFSIERICSSLGVPSVSEGDVRATLVKSGFRSFRQPFERTGLKTTAGHRAVEDAVVVASRRRERGALVSGAGAAP